MSHVIRLRGPWNVTALTANGESRSETIDLPLAPENWPEGKSIALQRRFGRPTGIEPGDRLLLVFSGGCRPSVIRLNGRELESSLHDDQLTCDVTQLLEARNTIEYTVNQQALPIATFEVRLEIMSAGEA